MHLCPVHAPLGHTLVSRGPARPAHISSPADLVRSKELKRHCQHGLGWGEPQRPDLQHPLSQVLLLQTQSKPGPALLCLALPEQHWWVQGRKMNVAFQTGIICRHFRGRELPAWLQGAQLSVSNSLQEQQPGPSLVCHSRWCLLFGLCSAHRVCIAVPNCNQHHPCPALAALPHLGSLCPRGDPAVLCQGPGQQHGTSLEWH